MVIEQRGCGWYFWYVDKRGTVQSRGPWFTGEQARKESMKWLNDATDKRMVESLPAPDLKSSQRLRIIEE